MRRKAEIWYICRRTTQTKGKNLKPRKFCSGQWGWKMQSLTYMGEHINAMRFIGGFRGRRTQFQSRIKKKKWQINKQFS
jgi:hypothetical protein